MIKKILTKTCVYYTVIITAFYTFGLLMNNSAQWIPTLRIAYSLLGFSLGFSALNEGIKRAKISFPAKFAVHLLSSAVLYYLIFVIGGGFLKNGGSTLAAMIVFAFVYAIGAVIILVLRWLLGTKKKEAGKADEAEYNSIFKK